MTKLEDITQHIIDYSNGEKIELGVIIDALYSQLCLIAQAQLNRYHKNTFSSQELVHELFLKFSKAFAVNATNRKHFMSISAKAMRQLIIDQIKSKSTQKRGGFLTSYTLNDNKASISENMVEILSINNALDKLSTVNPKLTQTVECRYFAGYSEKETAQAMGLSVRTIRRYWSLSKKWLELELQK